MPDFDVDFDERRRGEVIRYVTEKYGDDRVAQIVTYGTIKACLLYTSREEMITEARERSTGMVTEAQQKKAAILQELEQQKGVLEHQIEELRGFERNYRKQLRSYLEGQLADLDHVGETPSPAADAEGGEG